MTEREMELIETQDLTSDYETTLYFKNSFLINGDINNYFRTADFRFDNYQIDHILDMDILYYNFFRLITPNIVTYILRTSPNNDNPIKYTFVIHDDRSNGNAYIKNIKDYQLHLVIYLATTINLNKNNLINEIDTAITAKNYTNYDWLFTSGGCNTLTIIQERQTIPTYRRNNTRINFNSSTKLLESFKEDKCVICISNSPNIMFCDCGHLITCEECFKKLDNNKCPKCRKENHIIRKI